MYDLWLEYHDIRDFSTHKHTNHGMCDTLEKGAAKISIYLWNKTLRRYDRD